MDPIQNLAEQLTIANRIANDPDYPMVKDGDDIYQDAERLAELVLALDEWMRKGGFSPWNDSAAQESLRQRKLLIDMAAGVPPPMDIRPFGTQIRKGIQIIKDWWR